MRPAEQTAVLIAAMLKASGKTRARLSIASLKLLALRSRRLSQPYQQRVRDTLEADYNIIMCELDRGGFGLIMARALEGAPTLTPTVVDRSRAINDELLDELAVWSGQELDACFHLADSDEPNETLSKEPCTKCGRYYVDDDKTK